MNALSESQARAALAALRSEPVDAEGVEDALGLLLRDLTAAPSHRPLLIPALGLGALGVAILLVLGLTLGRGSQRGGHLSPVATPAASLRPGTLATGLTGVTSLVDVNGYLWASGSYPGGVSELVHVQVSTGKASNALLENATTGLTVPVSHLATAEGRVLGVTGDGGVQSFAADGTASKSVAMQELGSFAESLAASPATGLWMLSCCGAAPAGQGLVQQRDVSALAGVGLPRQFAPFGGALAAGPAGVWFLDGDSGEIRRVSSTDTPASDPQVEENSGQLSHDQLAVASLGPVLAKAHELLTVDATTLAVHRTPIPDEAAAATALTVVGNTAYLAFPDRVARYDLSTLMETGSFAVTATTALAAGIDGVWAATNGRLVRLDTLPVLPPLPMPTHRTIPTTLTGISALIDVDDHLWVSSKGKLSRVDLADGSLHPERPGGPGAPATDGTFVDVAHPETGEVDSFAASGESLQSANLAAQGIAASKAGLSVLSCCQHVRGYDAGSLQPLDSDVGIPAKGEGGQLIAGDAGTWFLTADSKTIYRVDTTPVRPLSIAPTGQQSGSLIAMSNLGPVVATADGMLRVVDGSTVRAVVLPQVEPKDLTVWNDTIYLAFANKIITYSVSKLMKGPSYPIPDVTALTSGPDGVWAATEGSGTLVQVARP